MEASLQCTRLSNILVHCNITARRAAPSTDDDISRDALRPLAKRIIIKEGAKARSRQWVLLASPHAASCFSHCSVCLRHSVDQWF